MLHRRSLARFSSLAHVSSPLLVGLLALGGCDPEEIDEPDAAVAEPDANVAEDAGAEPMVDAGRIDRAAICDELGLPRAAMREGTGVDVGEVAGDFRVETLSGPFQLASEWSGCESYVFFTYFPGASGDALFGSLVSGSLLQGPRNVQYFFSSNEEAPEARVERATNLSGQLEAAFDGLAIPEGERTAWRQRFHFVTDRASEIEGSAGDYLREYIRFAATPEARVDLGDRGVAGMIIPLVYAIDRAQEWDSGDDLSPTVGQPPSLAMGVYLPRFYDYRFALDARLAAETDTTIVPLLDHERTTDRVFVRTVTLPDEAAMAAFDTLEFDVEITCEARNLFACSEWDRIANVVLCADGEPCADRRELVRWITPYWRRGRQRYAIDASALLGLVRAGGDLTFRVELGPEWERPTEWLAHVALRLRTAGDAPRSEAALLAFTGGTFDATYNEREPFRFTVPASATRVELVTILSGHGQETGNNCAEWCDHRHTFTVNGTALAPIRNETGIIGNARGCAERAVERGAIPGQAGNWAPNRAYWCPGMPVDARRDDITSLVAPGEEATLEYRGSYVSRDPAGGDIALSAYVVWYE